MKQHLTRLAGQTVVYGLGAVAIQLTGVLTLPVYARVFDPAEYGVVEVLTVGLSALAIFVDLGVGSGAQRSWFDYSDEQGRRRGIVLSTAVTVPIGMSILIAGSAILLREPLAGWLLGSEEHATALAFAAAMIPTTALGAFCREVLRLRFEAWRYLTSSLIAAVVSAVGGVVAVTAFDAGIEGVFIGGLIGNALSLAYAAAMAAPHIGRSFSQPELRKMLAYGLPIVPAAVSLWLLQFVDRIILSKLADLHDVGQYAIANRLSLILMLLVAAFATAYPPFMLSMHADDPEAERVVRGHTLTYLLATLALAGVAISVFSRELVDVLAPGYDEAHEAVFLLIVGTIAYGTTTVTMAGISIERRTGFFALYTGIAAAVNIGLNFALIPSMGMLGSALATAIGYVLLAALYYRRAQRIAPAPFEPYKLIATAAAATALAAVGLAEPLALRVAALLAFVVALRALRVIGPPEIAEARSIALRLRAALR